MQLQLNLTLDRTFAEFRQIKNTKKHTNVDNDMMHVENDKRQSTLIHTFFSFWKKKINLLTKRYELMQSKFAYGNS